MPDKKQIGEMFMDFMAEELGVVFVDVTPTEPTAMPKRIQRKRTKGWKMPANAVYVGRPSKWGNPFKVGEFDVSREKCLAAYRALYSLDYDWFSRRGLGWTGAVYLGACGLGHSEKERIENLNAKLAELRGKDLACWCAEDQPCHADILLELANGT